jgi:hypothetical protein
MRRVPTPAHRYALRALRRRLSCRPSGTRRAVTDERERTLDEEGVPDLEGPLPEKAKTGDPQEGAPPPNEEPQGSVEHGVAPAEEREGEPIDVRVSREEADTGASPPVTPRERVQASEPQGTRDDTEKDLTADEAPVEGALDPEEDAMRVEEEP